MKPKFRLIHNYQLRQVAFWLQKQRDQADGSQRTVRKLVRAKHLVRSFLSPVQNDVRTSTRWFEFEVVEKGRNKTNGRDNAAIDPPAIFLAESQQKRCQVPRVEQQATIVADVVVLSNSGCERRVVEVVDAALVEKTTKYLRCLVFSIRYLANVGFLVS